MGIVSASLMDCFSCSICVEKAGVDFFIEVFEHVEDHLLYAGFLVQEGFSGLNGDFGCTVVREMEFASGDAAEGDALKMVGGCQC